MMSSDMLNWMQQQQSLMLHMHQVRIFTEPEPSMKDDASLSKKRKTEKSNHGGESEKRMKQSATNEAENKKKREELEDGSKSKEQKTDYIHVRARRGQATDSHSLAERVRREKISERMKYLQDLVPGCSNITGKASILDEIINYVQSLQKQIEFLSMKLAAAYPVADCSSMRNHIEKEVQVNSSCCTVERSLELQNPSFQLLDHLQPDVGASQNELSFMECGSSAWDYNHMTDVHKLDCLGGMESSIPFHLFPAEQNSLM